MGLKLARFAVQVCGNAYRLYVKTRPAPSIESVARAKQLPKEGTHPLLRTKVSFDRRPNLAFPRAFEPAT